MKSLIAGPDEEISCFYGPPLRKTNPARNFVNRQGAALLYESTLILEDITSIYSTLHDGISRPAQGSITDWPLAVRFVSQGGDFEWSARGGDNSIRGLGFVLSSTLPEGGTTFRGNTGLM